MPAVEVAHRHPELADVRPDLARQPGPVDVRLLHADLVLAPGEEDLRGGVRVERGLQRHLDLGQLEVEPLDVRSRAENCTSPVALISGFMADWLRCRLTNWVGRGRGVVRRRRAPPPRRRRCRPPRGWRRADRWCRAAAGTGGRRGECAAAGDGGVDPCGQHRDGDGERIHLPRCRSARGLAGAGSGAVGQWPASSESSRAVKAVHRAPERIHRGGGRTCAAATRRRAARRVRRSRQPCGTQPHGPPHSSLGEPMGTAPGCRVQRNGRGSGGWGAGMLEATGSASHGAPSRRVPRSGARRAAAREDDWALPSDSAGARTGWARVQRSAWWEPPVASTCVTPAIRVVAGLVEQRGVGERKRPRPRAGRARRGARSGGGRRGGSRVEYSPSASGHRPSWVDRPRRSTGPCRTSPPGWSARTHRPGSRSRARRAGRSGAVPGA